MKFSTFTHYGRDHVGMVDVAHQSLRPIEGVVDMIDLITRYESLRRPIVSTAPPINLTDVRLRAPITLPRRNIFCVGKNYREHAKEFSRSGFEAGAVKGAEVDEYPAVFSKGPNTVVGPFADVQLHSHITSSVDYEAELGVIVGRAGKDIAQENAYKHIFGYTIINDVTARDRQKNHKQWYLGKTLDTFCPMGPWIAPSDEAERENLGVKCCGNRELGQDGSA